MCVCVGGGGIKLQQQLLRYIAKNITSRFSICLPLKCFCRLRDSPGRWRGRRLGGRGVHVWLGGLEGGMMTLQEVVRRPLAWNLWVGRRP